MLPAHFCAVVDTPSVDLDEYNANSSGAKNNPTKKKLTIDDFVAQEAVPTSFDNDDFLLDYDDPYAISKEVKRHNDGGGRDEGGGGWSGKIAKTLLLVAILFCLCAAMFFG